MADNTHIQWTDTTWNVATGCTKISEGCENCLAPETLVLRSDMAWVPIKDIHVGDTLVSFTETPKIGENRKWEIATVEATMEVEKPTVEVELANGTLLVASEDHRWLIAHRGKDTWWRESISLNFKTSLRVLRCEPTNSESVDYQAGYIAGVTAGDGTFRWDPSWRSSSLGYPQSYWRVAKLADDQAVLDRLVAYLARFGVNVAVRPFDHGKSTTFKVEHPRPMAKVETRRLGNMPIIAGLAEERDSREYKAGWLAGLFDTDASYTGGSLRFCQSKPNDVLDRVIRYATELGFDATRERHEKQCPTVRLGGGVAECIAFLSAISPALERRCQDFYGRRIETPVVPVVGVRRGPVRRLIDITTSTGTFIAEGALTHNCYIPRTPPFRMQHRQFDKPGIGGTTGVELHPDRITQSLRWRKPRRVFVNSLTDLFHEDIPDEYIARTFAVMALTPQHTYQVLTKRPARMRSLLNSAAFEDMVDRALLTMPEASNSKLTGRSWPLPKPGWPLPNAHLGVSTESQKWADIRIPALLDTPAAVRFISAEPLLGPVDLSRYLAGGLGWTIVGGESGPGARPMDPAWAQQMVDQCGAAGVPVFVKQLGSVWAHDHRAAHSKGGDPDEWPESLRVREFPRTPGAVTV